MYKYYKGGRSDKEMERIIRSNTSGGGSEDGEVEKVEGKGK